MVMTTSIKELTKSFKQLKQHWNNELQDIPEKIINPDFRIIKKIPKNVERYLKIVPGSKITYIELYHKFFIHLIKNDLMNNGGIITNDIPELKVKTGDLFVNILSTLI